MDTEPLMFYVASLVAGRLSLLTDLALWSNTPTGLFQAFPPGLSAFLCSVLSSPLFSSLPCP